MRVSEPFVVPIYDEPVKEAAYPNNIGMMEMFKFYQIATNEQKEKMKELITKKLFDQAWEMLETVTGVKLHPVK